MSNGTPSICEGQPGTRRSGGRPRLRFGIGPAAGGRPGGVAA